MSDEPIPLTTMVLNGLLQLKNIMSGESEDHKIEDVNKKKVILLSDSDGQIVERQWTAQAVCDSQPFRDFVRDNLGQSISVVFEGNAYYGYITEYEIDDHERTIDFSFSSVISFPLPENEPPRWPTL